MNASRRGLKRVARWRLDVSSNVTQWTRRTCRDVFKSKLSAAFSATACTRSDSCTRRYSNTRVKRQWRVPDQLVHAPSVSE